MNLIPRKQFISSVGLSGLGLCLAPSLAASSSHPSIDLGIDTLEKEKFKRLFNKKVGLLTHPAGVNKKGISTIEVLRKSPGFRLVALFGPEHGIYGDEKANVPVDDRIDPKTRLPVYSLYGKYRKPTPEMLKSIDALIVDLQDVGTRSYTYVSCMRYVMEACFEQGKEVIILDRPNPIGGLKIDGPMLEEEWMSYVGAFPVPYVHGMTIAELAYMAKKVPGILKISDPIRRKGKLTLIPMRAWSRNMLWPQTGLKWIPTSPAIPDLSAAMGYPMTGLGTQLGGFSHGYGTQFPFRLLQFPGKSPEFVAKTLIDKKISGLSFKVIIFTHRGKERRGAYVLVSNWNKLSPTHLSFHMMQLTCQWSPQNPFRDLPNSKISLFNKHVGDSSVFESFQRLGAKTDLSNFFQKWAQQNSQFRKQRSPYLLY